MTNQIAVFVTVYILCVLKCCTPSKLTALTDSQDNVDLTGNFMNTLLELNTGVESFVSPRQEDSVVEKKSPVKLAEKGELYFSVVQMYM